MADLSKAKLGDYTEDSSGQGWRMLRVPVDGPEDDPRKAKPARKKAAKKAAKKAEK